jgi:hypothetical protein
MQITAMIEANLDILARAPNELKSGRLSGRRFSVKYQITALRDLSEAVTLFR